MYLRYFITMVIILPLAQSYYENVSFMEFDNSSLEEELAYETNRLVRKCLTKYNKLITLSGEMSDKLIEEIYKLEFTAVTRMSIDAPLIDKVFTIAKQSLQMYNHEYYFRFEHKAQGFLLAAASQQILHRQIREIKNSRWWNARGLFFIIDDGKTINSCKSAREFLWLTWHYNILSSVYLCHDKNESLMMYSYNPYNRIAPKNWLKVGELHGRAGHPWILFKRNLSENPENCTEIFFEKTKTLENYKIRSNMIPLKPRLSIDYTKNGLERYSGEDGQIMQCIFRFLNASNEDIPYRDIKNLGNLDGNGTYSGIFIDIFSGKVDIGLNGKYMVQMWKLGNTYPHTSIGLCFVVKSKGNLPQWMNLAVVYDIESSLGLITVILLTTAVLSFYSNVSSGCMNSLRLVISASLIRLPSQFPARLFLANVFLLFLITNGTFQGRLVSFITKPRAHRNPETQFELGNAGYKLVGHPAFARYIADPVLGSHVTFNESTWDCIERLIDGEHITCVQECHGIYMFSENFDDLHVVSQRLQTFHVSFFTSLDWPLLDRFDRIIKRLFEAGFPDYWRAKDQEAAIIHHHYGTESHYEETNSKILSFEDLAFIFHWLLLGLFFASLVFFYEVISFRCKMKFSKNHRVS